MRLGENNQIKTEKMKLPHAVLINIKIKTILNNRKLKYYGGNKNHMKRLLLALALSTMACMLTFAQLPQNGLKGYWKFDDAANLMKATVGNALTKDQLTGATPVFKSVSGPAASDGAIEVGIGSFLRCFHDISPNGSDTAKRVNQYTIVIDFKMPVGGSWYSFFASNTDPASDDAELFVNASGHIGVGTTGYSYDTVTAGEWYRLIVSADLGKSYKYYIDGRLMHDGGTQKLDGRFSLSSINDANQVLFFSDNDGEDATIDCAQLALYNRAFTADEIYTLGGYNHAVSLKIPISEWAFDKPDSLLFPTVGKQLQLTGVQTAITGPAAGDGAVSLDPASYYTAHPIAYKNGGGNNVNSYTIAMDIRIPAIGKQYSLYQTNGANTDSAEIVINKEGRIGSPSTGFIDKVLTPGEWYRVGLSIQLGNSFTFYLDGDSLRNAGPLAVDGRFSLSPADADGRVLFFTGAKGEDNGMDVAHITMYNRSMTALEIKGLGGFSHEKNTEVTASGKSVYMDGSSFNRYVSVPYSSDFDFGESTSFTVEVWTKPNLVIDGDPSIISNKDWGSGGNIGWGLFIHQEDWKVNFADGSVRYDITQPKIADGNWHYLALIIDRTNQSCKILTDTIVTVDIPFTKGLKSMDSQLNINMGQDGTGNYSDGYKYPGEIDEVRIWKGVVTDPAVLKEWKFKSVTSAHPYYNNLIGYWKFDEGTGTTIADESGKGHSATLINGPVFNISYAPIADSLVATGTEINAVWGAVRQASSGGLTINGAFPATTALKSFFNPNGQNNNFVKSPNAVNTPFADFSHNNLDGATTSNVSGLAVLRTGRIWTMDVTNTAVTADVIFDFSAMNIGTPGDSSNYVLLSRKGTSEAFAIVSSTVPNVINSTQLIFKNIQLSDNRYALGTKNSTKSPLGTKVDVKNEIHNMTYTLNDAYPNPFNPSTNIKFSLATRSNVTLTIYNALGQQVQSLVNGQMDAGSHTVVWNAKNSLVNCASGIYFYKLSAVDSNGEKFDQTKKLLLIK